MREIRKEQLDFLDWEFGIFLHFGIRTFYEGHKDWDMEEMPAEGFNPTELDCENWIRISKEAGAKYAILVCKHHDGFANWPSAYTEYSVANTPWKDGKGDVVREFVDACHKYDMKVGLYYSPAQFGSEQQESKSYDDYFINQISELLTNYGKVDYLWFDGNGSANHKYDTDRIVREIRRMQPDILIFNMWDPDTRWVGNESGFAAFTNPYMISELDFSVQNDRTDLLDEKRFLPGECDCRMRLENWFYSDNDIETVKSVDELMGIYYASVGRGANLLLNIGPDRRGLLPDEDAARLLEFGREIKKLYDSKLQARLENNGNTYTLTLPEHTLVDHVIIEEDVTTGGNIEKFEIYVYPYSYGKPILAYSGTTAGHKRICQFPAMRTEKVEVVVEGKNTPKINDITLYYTK